MSNHEDYLGKIKSNWQRRAEERTTFRAELRVIPRWLVRVMLGLYVAAVAALVFLGIFAPQVMHTTAGASAPQKVLLGFVIVTAIMIVLSAVVFLYGYIGADAKRRGMSPVLWVLVSLFVPYLIGVILYFVVREPLHLNCPQCGHALNPHFNFCPACQFNLRPTCPQCRRTTNLSDRFCPHCGAVLEAEASAQPGAPRA